MLLKRFGIALVAVLCFSSRAADIDWQPLGEPGGGGAFVSIGLSPFNPKHLVVSGDMLGVGWSTDGGETWRAGRGLTCYEMASVTFSATKRDEVWVGSCAGPYRSSDGGRTWKSFREGLPKPSGWSYSCFVEKVLYDPTQPGRLLAFGGSSRHWREGDTFGRVWESADDGAHWRFVGTFASEGFVKDEKKGGNVIRAFWGAGAKPALHVVTDGLVGAWWTSGDAGRTWRRREPKGVAGPIFGLTVHPSDPRVFWLSTGPHDGQPGGLYRSDDGGETFVASDAGIPKVTQGDNNHLSHFFDVAVSAAAPDKLYVSDHSWSSSVLYTSEDGGRSWSARASRVGVGEKARDDKKHLFPIETACFAGPTMRFFAAPSVGNVAYGFNTEYILRTTDGGRTWTDVTSRRPDPNRPDHWRGRGWNGWCSTDFVFNPYRRGQSLALGMDACRGWLSDDGFESWHYTRGQANPWMGGHSAAFSKDGHIYITTGQFGSGNGIQHSSDGGRTWTTLEGEARGLPRAGWGSGKEYAGVYCRPEDGRRAWAVCDGRLLATEDAGEHWAPVGEVTAASHLAGDPTHRARFYVKTSGGVLVTEDGKTFTNLGLADLELRGRMNCDARGRLLVCVYRAEKKAGLWRYDPSTKAWTRLLDEAWAVEANADPADPARLMLVTTIDPYFDHAVGHGVWTSVDDGTSWSRADATLPMTRANACAFDPFDPECVVVGTYGQGFYRGTWRKTDRAPGTRRYVSTARDAEEAKLQPPTR